MDTRERQQTVNEPLRITSKDLQAQQVDDLLNRQKSLMGKAGQSRDKRRWWLRSWFVLMLAGGIGAFWAWAVLEPYFSDSIYLQGRVEERDLSADMPANFISGDDYLTIKCAGKGYVQVRGQKIWLLEITKEITPEGEYVPLRPETLAKEQRLGLYVEGRGLGDNVTLAFASYVVRNPPVDEDELAQVSMFRLASRSSMASTLLFSLVAGFVGLFIGLVDGLICRAYRRAILSALVGFFCGLAGGFLTHFAAEWIYSPINKMAMQDFDIRSGSSFSTLGFVLQMSGRGLAWAVAGMAAGLGQGLVLGSRRLIFYGFLGGVIGGLFGGLIFDPIYFLVQGGDVPEAWLSRMIGLTSIGVFVGAMIGVVELMTRDAWLRMQQGPLRGKEFLIFKDVMTIGSSPSSALYLFNDKGVNARHAVLRTVGDKHEIESEEASSPVLVNGHSIKRVTLRHGDRIVIGSTAFVYEKRGG